ncbi:MAG: hypothetical protein GC172_12840 [Phycisphaera sp.]|nr:hypothetical protein [Phycisphaera sp.]
MPRDEDFVELTRAANEPLAGLIVAALERDGVPSFVQGAFVGNLGLFGALGGVPRVMVRAEDLSRAQRVLDELEGRMPESEDGGDETEDEPYDAADDDGFDDPSLDDPSLDDPSLDDDDFGAEDELHRRQ